MPEDYERPMDRMYHYTGLPYPDQVAIETRRPPVMENPSCMPSQAIFNPTEWLVKELNCCAGMPEEKKE